MVYPGPLEKFVDPARRRPALWRLFAGVVLFFVVYTLVVAGLTAVVVLTVEGADVTWLMTEEAMADPWALSWLLSTFLGMLIAPMVVVRVLNARGPGTLFGRAPVVIRDFALAGAGYLAIGLPLMVLWIAFGGVVPNLDPWRWVAFLPLTVVLIGIQTLAEELIFRGYLLQQLAARFASRIVWMVLPSLIFGALHFNPSTPPADAFGVVAVISLFGLIAADLTARSGSIGAAWGFHFANNMMAISLVSVDGTLTGLSLFRTTFSARDGLPAALYFADILLILAAWWLMRRLVQR